MAMMLQPQLQVKIVLDPAGAVKGASVVSKNLSGINKAVGASTGKMDGFSKTLKSMWRISGGIILFNIIRKITHAIEGMTQAAMDFDTQMRNVTSITGNKGADFQKLSDDIINLALDPKIKDGPAALAEGMYEIVSAGYKAADAMTILKAASYAATAGLTDTKTSVDALTTVLLAYNLGAEESTNVSDTLFATVKVGKLTYDELANSIGNVIPTAAALGVPLDQVGAAMASITLQGKDAASAATYLNAIFTAFLKPTQDLTDALLAHGYASGYDAIKTLGITDGLALLNKIIEEGSGNITDYVSDSRAFRGALALLNNGGELYASSLKEIDKGQEGVGATQEALTEQMKSASFQIAVLHKNVQILATLGFGLLAPYLVRATSWFNKFFSDLLLSFRHFRDKGYDVFHGMRAALKTVITDMFGKDTAKKVLYYFDKLVDDFYAVKKAVLQLWPYVKMVLDFMGKHLDSVIKIIAGVAIGLQILPPLIAAIGVAITVLEFLFSPIGLVILAIVATVIILYEVWHHNIFGMRTVLKALWGFIVDFGQGVYIAFKPVIDIIQKLIHYIRQVAKHSIEPKDMTGVPKKLQPIFLVIGRIVKAIRSFIVIWKEKGPLEALKNLSTQFRAMGRALSRFFDQIGLHYFAQAVKKTFYSVASMIKHVIILVDDLVHGRWDRIWGDLKAIAVDYIHILISQLGQLLGLVVDLVYLVPWDTVLKFLMDKGKDFVSWLWSGLESMASWLWDMLKTGLIDQMLAQAIWGAKQLYNIGRDFVSWLWTGIASLAGWIKDQFWNFIHGIELAAEGLWNTFYNLGKYIVSGIWAGISDLGGWLYSLVWNFVDANIVGSVKKKLHIDSPSKVFADIGHNVMMGLSMGFTKGSKIAARTLTNSINGMTKTSMNLSIHGNRKAFPTSNYGNGQGAARPIVFGERAVVVELKSGSREDANQAAKFLVREVRRLQAAG